MRGYNKYAGLLHRNIKMYSIAKSDAGCISQFRLHYISLFLRIECAGPCLFTESEQLELDFSQNLKQFCWSVDIHRITIRWT